MAHGIELQTQTRLSTFAGMIIATALLHGAGLLLGSQQVKMHKLLQRCLAYTMLFVGAYWLVAA